MENIKSRYFMFIIYTDNDEHLQSLDYIKKNYNYVGILHNQDKTEDGEIKKQHYHIIIKFENQRGLHSVCNEIGIEENYCKKLNSYTRSLRYLIHRDNPDKYQYNIDEVFGTLIDDFNKAINDETEEDSVIKIIDIIENNDIKSLKQLCLLMCKNHLYSTFRRNYSLFKDIFMEKF